jgi:hypothetical protein
MLLILVSREHVRVAMISVPPTSGHPALGLDDDPNRMCANPSLAGSIGWSNEAL